MVCIRRIAAIIGLDRYGICESRWNPGDLRLETGEGDRQDHRVRKVRHDRCDRPFPRYEFLALCAPAQYISVYHREELWETGDGIVPGLSPPE